MRVTLIEAADRAARRRHARLTDWHRYFLLWPLWVAEDDCRWLEWVERKGECHAYSEGYWWRWSFRLPLSTSEPTHD